MARREPPQHIPGDPDTPIVPGEGADQGDRGPARQQEILAQFEQAIAQMHTREIQIGLRRLLAQSAAPGRPAGLAGIPARDSARAQRGDRGTAEPRTYPPPVSGRPDLPGAPGPCVNGGPPGATPARQGSRHGAAATAVAAGTVTRTQPGPSATPQPGPSATPQPGPSATPQPGPSATPQPDPSPAPRSGPCPVPRDVTAAPPVTGTPAPPQAGTVTPPQARAAARPRAGTGASPAGGTAVRPRAGIGVPPVAGLARAITDPCARRQLERLVADAELEAPVQVGDAAAAWMVRPYTWLLNWVGPGGIRLTDAGHLPPADVAEAADELNCCGGFGERRENQVRPVRQLRESAQAMGLVQKQRGRLVRTAHGAALRSDPAALWWHLAERMPLRPAVAREALSREAEPGLILLICVAARCTGTLSVTIARLLTAVGWAGRDGRPVTSSEAVRGTSCTAAVLRRLGALADGPRPAPTPDGVTFARAALRTWPSA